MVGVLGVNELKCNWYSSSGSQKATLKGWCLWLPFLGFAMVFARVLVVLISFGNEILSCIQKIKNKNVDLFTIHLNVQDFMSSFGKVSLTNRVCRVSWGFSGARKDQTSKIACLHQIGSMASRNLHGIISSAWNFSHSSSSTSSW